MAPKPRSAADATRFTATGPHAANRSSLLSAKETPLEKVARLRAEKQRAKLAEVSSGDRLIMRGRVVADKLHRFTALSLLGLTGTLFFVCWS
jgi:hypothetical protein